MAATANFWDVQTANHSLIAKAYAQKLSHGIDNNKNQLMPTPQLHSWATTCVICEGIEPGHQLLYHVVNTFLK